jgi:hypothetical protein
MVIGPFQTSYFIDAWPTEENAKKNHRDPKQQQQQYQRQRQLATESYAYGLALPKSAAASDVWWFTTASGAKPRHSEQLSLGRGR